MTDIMFFGYSFQLAHNLLYMYLCYFIFETFKIKNNQVNSSIKYRMDLDDDSHKLDENLEDPEK